MGVLQLLRQSESEVVTGLAVVVAAPQRLCILAHVLQLTLILYRSVLTKPETEVSYLSLQGWQKGCKGGERHSIQGRQNLPKPLWS